MGRRLGVSRYNEEGNWSALFANYDNARRDPHNEWQPAMGYAEKGWYLDDAKDFRLGLGAAGITAREMILQTMSRYRLSSRCFPPGISALPSSSPIFPEHITTATCSLPWLRLGF